MSAWINIKDKLPDKEGYYLCFNHKWKNKIKILEFNGKIFWCINKDKESSYWMPLPEPPKNNNGND